MTDYEKYKRDAWAIRRKEWSETSVMVGTGVFVVLITLFFHMGQIRNFVFCLWRLTNEIPKLG